MSTQQVKNGIVIYCLCKNRWYNKYCETLLFDFKKFKYCKPYIRVDVWQKSYGYYRIQIFKGKYSSYYCS